MNVLSVYIKQTRTFLIRNFTIKHEKIFFNNACYLSTVYGIL
jgi:hypothetical protein